jgi:hypothetical protein
VDDRNVTHHNPAQKHEHDIPSGPRSEGRGDTKRALGAEGGPEARSGAGFSGSVGAAVGASEGVSGTRTGRPEAHRPEEEASAGLAVGMAGGEEGVGKKQKGGSAVVWTPA